MISLMRLPIKHHKLYRNTIVCSTSKPMCTKHIDSRDKIPKSIFEFAFENAKKELFQKRYGFLKDPYSMTSNSDSYSDNNSDIRKQRGYLKRLKLSNENIWIRENQRETVPAPRLLMIIYYGVCFLLDLIYDNKPIDRFWFLETVARMPYFSYVATIHMYETLGWWEIDGQLKRLHLNEEINEAKHLRIMESLGGDSLWWNRFLARHGAMVYYVVLVILFMVSPRLAYMCSELLELHAVDTYDEFFQSNEQVLKELPLTSVAREYNPNALTFYDVFVQISNDEKEHADTMRIVRNLKQ
jgi:ubiquinol oxidase